jgi:hypothetical protein
VRSVAALVRRGQWHTALVALVCAGLFMSAASLFCLRQYALHGLSLAAHSLAFAGEPALRFRDLEALRELAVQLAEREQLASVQVLDAGGRTLLRFERPGRPRSGALARWAAGLLLPQPVSAPVEGARADRPGAAAHRRPGAAATWVCWRWPCWAVCWRPR